MVAIRFDECSTKPLVLVGAGGYGRELAWLIRRDFSSVRILGFLDNRFASGHIVYAGLPVLGSPELWEPSEEVMVVVALGIPAQRLKYHALMAAKQWVNFPTLCSPSNLIDETAQLGQGGVIGPDVFLSVDVIVGDQTFIQGSVAVGHDAQIGAFCQINTRVAISGGAKIGNAVLIQPNCVITSRATIEDGVTVAPGSVVYGRVRAGKTVLGNPARTLIT